MVQGRGASGVGRLRGGGGGRGGARWEWRVRAWPKGGESREKAWCGGGGGVWSRGMVLGGREARCAYEGGGRVEGAAKA